MVRVLGSGEEVLQLWESLTGTKLTPARRDEFLSRAATVQLARYSEKRLRKAARREPRGEKGEWLLLDSWLHHATQAKGTVTTKGDHFDDSHKGRPFDAYPRAPPDADLLRRLGPTQRYDDST
jgi:hypothetical protein